MVKSDSVKWIRGILRKIKRFWYWMTNGFFYLLTFNFRADIMTRNTFNQVRCFFTFSIDFMDTPVKYMNNKFPVLTNIYIWSSYRKLVWVEYEPTTTEFRSDALTDWAIRPWVQLALRAIFVQPLQFHLFVHLFVYCIYIHCIFVFYYIFRSSQSILA